jgi:DNA polymerase
MATDWKFRLLDFETLSLCDLTKVGAWRYAEDLTTEIICLSFEVSDTELVTWTPGDFGGYPEKMLLALARDPTVILVAHNAGFEKAIWRYIMVPRFGFPDVPDNRWHDTMAVAAQKALPQKLETVLNVLNLPPKDTEGSKLVMSFSKLATRGPNKGNFLVPRTPELLTRAYEYCENDVRDERALLNRLGGFQPGERQVWLLDQKINERGIMLDLDYIDACQTVVNDATKPLAAEFQQITGGLSFTQVGRIQTWIEQQGVYTIPDLKKETIVEALGHDIDAGTPDYLDATAAGGDRDHADLPERVRRALEIRQLVGSASVKKLAAMRACVGSDGRARGLLQYHGSASGRWAGRILQPQNFPRPGLKLFGEPVSPELIVDAINTRDWRHVEASVGPAVETVVSGLRHTLIASPGQLFVAGDFMGVEARVLYRWCGQDDKADLMAAGADVYADNASQIYKRPIDKKKDPVERDIGKHAVLGLGYQMGGRTFYFRYAKGHATLEFCHDVVQVYRKEWAPCVPKFWRALDEAALYTVYDRTPHEAFGIEYALEDMWLTARLPSGRKLYYANPTQRRLKMPWLDDDGEDVWKDGWTYEVMKNGHWQTVAAFGGLLTGHAVQATARDLLVPAAIKLERMGYPLVLTVHDELVADHPNPDKALFREVMNDIPPWAKAMRLPIDTDVWTGPRYKK